MNKKISILMSFVLLLTCSFTGCSGQNSRTFTALGKNITITIFEGNDEILGKAVELVNSLDQKLDTTNAESEISRLNASGGEPFEVSDELLAVLKYAYRYAERSEGAYDPTIGAVTSLWDFENETVPSDESIKEALKTVDYNNMVIDGFNVTLKNGAQIDLGGLTEGYIIDRVAGLLKQEAYFNAVLDFGGNIYTIGQENYEVGIKKPFSEGGISATLLLNDGAAITAGSYERFFRKDNKLYHNIIYPETGMPVNNELESVTVVCTSAVEAAAYSHAFFVLGRERATSLANSFMGISAIFIENDGKVYYTRRLALDENNRLYVKEEE